MARRRRFGKGAALRLQRQLRRCRAAAHRAGKAARAAGKSRGQIGPGMGVFGVHSRAAHSPRAGGVGAKP